MLNLTLVFTLLLSFFKINKYINFIIIMLFGLLLVNLANKFFLKYIGKNESSFYNKFLSIFAILINILFIAYYLYIKEYALVILLVSFLLVCLLITKIISKNKN